MELKEYFEKTKGIGVLATSDAKGNVNITVFSRPTFSDENTVIFVMAEHLNHSNLQTNPHAAYLFMEKGKMSGKRLYLTKIKEEKNPDLIKEVSKKRYPIFTIKYDLEPQYAVYFRIDKAIPLIADGLRFGD